LNELRAYPCEQPEVEVPGPGDIVVPLRIRHDGRELVFFSTVATFGTPLDVTVAELAIESFFLADPTRHLYFAAVGRAMRVEAAEFPWWLRLPLPNSTTDRRAGGRC
jgi:hypothetical protein